MTSKEVKQIISSAKNVAIMGHASPDLDCYGSLFSAKYLCEKLGVKAQIFGVTIDDSYMEEIFDYSQISTDFDPAKYDLVIMVDCNKRSRVDEIFVDKLMQHKNVLMIDHHPLQFQEEDVKFYVYPEICSASMLIGLLMKELKIELNDKVATYMFAGIVGDTGRFFHQSTDKQCFEYVSYLLNYNVDVQRIYDIYYRSKSLEQIEVQKYILNHFKIVDNHYCYVVISLKDLKKINARSEDVKMFLDDLRNVKDLYMTFFCFETEKENYYVSCRSRTGYDVSAVALKHGGGGHKFASGFKLKGNKKSVIKQIAKICEETSRA